jgi:predicted Zn-dependent protease
VNGLARRLEQGESDAAQRLHESQLKVAELEDAATRAMAETADLTERVHEATARAAAAEARATAEDQALAIADAPSDGQPTEPEEPASPETVSEDALNRSAEAHAQMLIAEAEGAGAELNGQSDQALLRSSTPLCGPEPA